MHFNNQDQHPNQSAVNTMNIQSATQDETLPETPQSIGCTLALHPVNGLDSDSSIKIKGKHSSVGSSEECDICLPHPEVAAHHLTLIACEDEWAIKANCDQTWINGKSVQLSDLQNGDLLQIGTLKFEIELSPRSNEEQTGSKKSTKKNNKKKGVEKNTRKKETNRSKKSVNDCSVDQLTGIDLSALDDLPQGDVAECLRIMKSLHKELEEKTSEMQSTKQVLEQEREDIRQTQQKLAEERQQLQDGFSALTQAREAMKVRESLLAERVQTSSSHNSGDNEQFIETLYRKSNEEKISDLRSEIADKFHLDFDDDPNALEQEDESALLPEFDEQEFAEMESNKSLDYPAKGDPNNEQTVDDEISKNGDLSVQEYMENLLERSRQSLPEDVTRNSPPLARRLPNKKKSKNQSREDVSNSESPTLDDSENLPRRQIDKQSVRADLQSMRKLANISARTAIARHSTKQSKLSIFLKLILMVFSFVLATGIYFLTTYEGYQFAHMLQAGAVSIGVIVLAELLRCYSRNAIIISYDSDDYKEEELQEIDYEINDSAILNSPELISESYQSNYSYSENDYDAGTEEDDDEEQTVLECESHDQNEVVSSKDIIMEIPDEPEFEE